MAISNFRGIHEREYRKNGVWKKETYEVGQFKQEAKYKEFPYGYYKWVNYSADFTDLHSGEDKYYALYEPSEVYLPKKYFTYKDFFSDSYLAGFAGFLSSAYSEDPNRDYWSKVYPLSSETYIFTKTLNNWYIFPVLRITLRAANMSSSGYIISRPVSINWELAMCKYLPEEIMFNSETQKWTLLNGTELQNGPDMKGGAYFGAQSHYMSGSETFLQFGKGPYTYYLPEQFSLGVLNFIEAIKELRIYTFAMRSDFFDYRDYENEKYLLADDFNFPRSDSYNEPFWGSFLVDLRNVRGYNRVSFSRFSDTADFNFVKIKWGSGPDPNDPFNENDPNDDDPGHGPGQNPGDSGGDGDHDNTSDEIKPPNVPSLSGSSAGLFTIYNPTQGELLQIGQKLWSPDALEAIKQYFTNPMDAVLGLSIIPVNPVTGSVAPVYLGMYNTEVNSHKVDSDYVIVDCGTIPITRYWGSYLDYDPYTKISCYLPYIGEIDVNPDQVMQKNVSVKYYVNVVTGDIVAMLCADGNVIYTAAGNCIRQLPLSNNDYSAIINTAVSAVSTLAMAAATSGVGNAAIAGAQEVGKSTELLEAKQTANSVGSGGSLVHDVMNAKFHYQHAGAIGTGSGQLSYQTPYLTIERPNLDLADNYKYFVGYPCNKTMTLSSCHGFTQIEATRLSVPGATDAEIAEISSLLVGGVII